MKYILYLTAALLAGCSASWSDGPYEVYLIDSVRTLGFRIGEGAYIGRIDEPKNINANKKYISVYACPEEVCAYYYIDRIKDHKFADPAEFVYGPYTKKAFTQLQNSLLLPELGSK